MKTINEIIQTMTKEEIKQHEDLIAESLKRERESIKRGKTTPENFKKLAEIFKQLGGKAEKINLILKKTDGRVH